MLKTVTENCGLYLLSKRAMRPRRRWVSRALLFFVSWIFDRRKPKA